MKRNVFFLAILLTTLAVTSTASATDWENALVTDRPDGAEASETVGLYHLQVETSFGFSRDKSASVTTRTYGFPTLLRFGLLERLEARVEGEIYNIQTATGSARENGFADLAIGAKWHLRDGGGIAPSLSFLSHLGLPTGQKPFTADGLEPSFKVIMDWELPWNLGLGTNLGFDIPVKDAAGRKHTRFLYAIALGYDFPWWKSRLGTFIEVSGAEPTRETVDGEHTFDTGLTFLITPDIQIDGVVNIGLNDNATDFSAGAGVSFRF